MTAGTKNQESHLQDMQAALKAAAIPDPRREARRLLALTLNVPELELLRGEERILRESQISRMRDLLDRRLAGEPLSRLRGNREFWSLDFDIDESTLDPRPDSECLVECVLKEIAQRFPDRPNGQGLDVLDLGTGSGCLLLALLSELPEARGLGVDLSFGATRRAAENASRLGLAARASFITGSWLDAIGTSWQVIVSNPPYIMSSDIPNLAPEVRDFDPPLALDGGSDGLAAYRAIFSDLGERLAPDGFAALEVGFDQRTQVAELAQSRSLALCGVGKDLGNRERCLVFEADTSQGP
jgi:release factor glutamine methyltransferase